MKWLLFVVGFVAALIALVAIAGALLPRNHTASRRVVVSRRPDEVFRDLTAVDAFPTWRPDVRKVERLEDRPSGPAWREIGRHGAIAFETLEAVAPMRLVTRVADPDLPFGGTWTFELAALSPGEGTRLTITERGVVRNPIFRFLSRFVFGHGATLEAYLCALGRKYGQSVTPVAAEE